MPIDLNDARPQPPDGYHAHPALYDINDLKCRLRERAAGWVPEHFPSGRISSDRREWRMANTRGDPPRGDGSCVIELQGEHAGCIRDWSTGEHGDQLDALGYATGRHGDALFEYAAGLVGATPANGHDHSYHGDHGKKAREIAFIRQHCNAALGTLVETYLNGRGLDLPDCADLAFHPSLTDWSQRVGRPAMVAVIRDPVSGEPTGGIHRTYLADDGRSKADIPKPKKTLGPSAGVVMLMAMPADGTLGIGEGIETSLAGAKIFGVPAWAALNAAICGR